MAQQETNTSFATQMNTMFSTLDKTKVPHGILLDYGMEFANVPAFNGTLSDSTYTDISRLKQIYNTLLSSRIRDISNGFVLPETFENNLKNNRTENLIVLSGLYFKYSSFIDNATTNNKLTYSNGKFYDKYVFGTWQNPYQERQTFVMTPAIKSYKGQNIQVKIPSAIFYSNYQSSIQNIQIDFDNGQGYVDVPFDQNLSVNYAIIGIKTWKYKLTLTNGTILYNQSRIKIEEDLNTIPYDTNSYLVPQTNSTTNPLYSRTITATTDYLGQYASVKLTIDDAGNNGIRKPLIVAEGFDLGVVLSPENANGIFDYANFRSLVFEGGTELRNLIYNTNKQYDIIYVDWNNGIDYLQRNAFALQAVIKWVNEQKALTGSTEKNVVLGQSMGGVIARYALADMEQKGLNHDTRLFVAHDAPQQGANIPVSLQFLYRHLTNQYLSIGTTLLGGDIVIPYIEDHYGVSKYLSVLDAPATRQLLANWSNSSYTIDNTVHTTFFNELKGRGLANSGGFPINCRNIALSNGAECGNTQNFNAGDLLINFNWNKSLTVAGDLLSLVYMPLAGGVNGLLLDNDFFGIQALGSLPGNSTFSVEFQAKSIPYGSGNQIYKGKISYTKKILWLIPVTVSLTDVQKNQPSGVLQYDNYGGGYYNVNNLGNINNLPNGLYLRDRFDFIPTASTLDIGKRSVTLTDTDYKRSYIGAFPPTAPKNSPFANFSTEFDKSNPNSHNKQHISFNDRNGSWLAKELNNLPEATDCSAFCSNAQITGSPYLCTTGVYSVTNDVQWTNWSITEGASLVTYTATGNQITLNQVDLNSSGYITISASYGNSKCGSTTVTKRIWVGRPTVQDHSINGGSNNVYTSTSSTFSVTSVPGASQYYWFIYNSSTNCGCTTDSNGLTICPQGTVLPKFSGSNSSTLTSSSTSATVNWGNCSGTYVVNCIAKNPCGEDGIYHKIVNVINYGGGGGSDPCEQSLTVYPNPVEGGEINIVLPPPGDPCGEIPGYESKMSEEEKTESEIRIYDLFGNQVYFNKMKGKESKININLKRGHYVLNVFTNNGKVKREVLIVK